MPGSAYVGAASFGVDNILPGDTVAIAVGTLPQKIVDSPASMAARTIHNAGAHVISLSRDSGVKAGEGFSLLPGSSQTVWVMPGESVWGVCAAEAASSYEAI